MRLEFLADSTVRVRSGKVEIGQGILTALAQIAADELGLPVECVRVVDADTRFGPDEGVTSGSLSIQDGGAALRQACRDAQAAAGGLAARFAEAGAVASAVDSPNAPASGRALPRVDLAAKFAGVASFIQDASPDGLLHGRVLHPPQPDGVLVEADEAGAQALPGVRAVHRDGQLLGVVADSGAAADRALQRLAASARWRGASRWLDDRQALEALTTTPPTASFVAGERVAEPAAGAAAPAIARTLRARYSKPWIAHASIAASSAIARWDDDGGLEVWTHSQGIFNLRRDLALAFSIDVDAVRVRHAHGAGCYGHNGADDVAWDAAWLARRSPGRPVAVQWRREDEMSRAPLGPGMVVELEADLDADGDVVGWRHTTWSQGHSNRPGRSATPALLGSWQTAEPFDRPASIDMPPATGGGGDRNAVPGYDLPAWRVVAHRVALAAPRSSALRSLGAYANVFAIESFVDEIAAATGVDPVQWRRDRLRHDARALAVLDLAVERSRATRSRDGQPPPDGAGRGVGVACARYKNTGAWCAVVADVEAAETLRVRRLTIAVDVGRVVNFEGVVAQIEGGAIQSTSWTLKEAVRFGPDGIDPAAWEQFPILRFSEVPEVAVHVVASDAPSLGAGEASIGPTAAAVANALADALGVRVRDLPLTPDRIVAAIHADPAADAPSPRSESR